MYPLDPREPMSQSTYTTTWTLASIGTFLAGCGADLFPSGGSNVDTTPPTAGVVLDGLGEDIDLQASTTRLCANWSGFDDPEGPISHYQWGIGTADGEILLEWTHVGPQSHATATDLTLEPHTTYVVLVRAVDLAGNISAPALSDGVTIDPAAPPGGPGRPAANELTLSVSQWGIEWTFAEQEHVGQFANGDWWVVGPIEITEITPTSTVVDGRTINGSMMNPAPDGNQGYDSTLYGQFGTSHWDADLNVAMGISSGNPLQLQSGCSVISTISQMEPASNGSKSQLQTAAVLTILDQQPPDGAFRPAYSGNEKPILHREADIDWSTITTLNAPTGTPSMSATAAKFERVWLDHCPGWLSRFMHPVENMRDYARDFTADIGTAALLVNLDYPLSVKHDLAIRLIQLGIDNWGNVVSGCIWAGDGGHTSGRKFPVLFAGTLLDDVPMLGVGTSHPSSYVGPGHEQNRSVFGEDSQTFYVSQSSPGVYNWGHGDYGPQHLGLAEWGISHSHAPSRDNVSWTHDPYRRCCTANSWVGQSLALRIMNLQGLWNHPAFFDYIDRYTSQEEVGSWTRAWVPWHETMWNTYRAQF